MLDTIYIGMSGLTSFSQGLSNISSNVANLNTTGFKGSELQFFDLFYQNQYTGSNKDQTNFLSQGSGVRAGTSSLRFIQGDFRQTGNDLDVAIDGNGFFVLKQDSKKIYTRAGQFEIDRDGFLVTRGDSDRVMGFANGSLVDINISGNRSVQPKPTTEIKLQNTLSVNSPTFSLSNVTVIDSLGKENQLTLNFVNDTANNSGRWTFAVLEGSTEISNGSVTYSGNGNPVLGGEKFSFTYSPSGANPTQITLDFAETNFLSSSNSSLSVKTQNGLTAGFLSRTNIDQNGFLVLTYSNGQTINNSQLALANFQNLSVLQPQGGNRFEVFGTTKELLGTPGSFSLGRLRTTGIELSNVDLAKEFSELIIVQRAFQASSQVITTANEMIQQLNEIRGRR